MNLLTAQVVLSFSTFFYELITGLGGTIHVQGSEVGKLSHSERAPLQDGADPGGLNPPPPPPPFWRRFQVQISPSR